MREKMLSVGDDYWIEKEGAGRAYYVDGKALRLRQTFVLEDPQGHEVAKIQERLMTVRDKMEIERDGHAAATVKKALIGLRDRFSINLEQGGELKATGNIVDHEYEIERDGDTIATVSKKWFRARETYGVEVAPNEDDALLLAVTVCIDSMSEKG